MAKINKTISREILDPRGNPIVEADVRLDDGHLRRAAISSGTSTGEQEAVKLPDGEKPSSLDKDINVAAGIRAKSSAAVLKNHGLLMAGNAETLNPHCNTNFEYLRLVEFAWIPTDQCYYVHAKICRPCSLQLGIQSSIIEQDVMDIATSSRCSCGATLEIAEHWMKWNGHEWEFEGFFVCSVCHLRNKSTKLFLEKIMEFLRHIKKIRIGLKGVELEKNEAPRSLRETWGRVLDERINEKKEKGEITLRKK